MEEIEKELIKITEKNKELEMEIELIKADYIDNIPIETVEELYSFLQGNIPEGLTLVAAPKLSKEQAFSIIYYLQEVAQLLPEKYEKCKICGRIYDSENEGQFIDEDTEGNYCESDYGNYCYDCEPIDDDYGV